MAVDTPYTLLQGKYKFPLIGLGTFKGDSGDDEVYQATKVALEIGYRHIDTAYIYQTEAAVGKAIREHPNLNREEVFVVSKLWQTFHQPEHVEPALERTLKNLGFDYLDLYLMHWPMAWEFRGYEFDNLRCYDADGNMPCVDVPVIDTWRAMEKLVEKGSVRMIGVSNFTIPMLERLLAECNIKPVVNEIEVHPAFPQTELIEYCRQHNIFVSAYSPLGNPGYKDHKMPVLEEPRIIEIAEKYNLTPQQLFIFYGVSRGYAVIPKSVTPSRIKANFDYVKIADEDIEEITKIGLLHKVRTCDPVKLFGRDNNVFGDYN
ncbi:NADP-dependent oxidoreductase domain-containing protein [Chlamydoabsidia padenii]|nr:NADP-dependent oxidoreductase domain-containing protein [Chlamydoabsidia padenii]